MRTLRASSLRDLVLLLLTTSVPAQLRVRPVGELPNDVALRLLLRKLASTGTFMETTAHPDDEDNALLAMMSHGRGMRTTLVSATRGDGGQNEIGPELFQALGVLRTEELLAVHRFDGAEQYFTRAVDFGFSFSIEESIEKWGHDEIVGDYVRHIRTIRPDVDRRIPVRRRGRRTTSSGVNTADARGVSRGSRSIASIPNRSAKGFVRGRPNASSARRLWRTRAADARSSSRVRDERVRSAARADVFRARARRPEHAQVSGHVAASDAARRHVRPHLSAEGQRDR